MTTESRRKDYGVLLAEHILDIVRATEVSAEAKLFYIETITEFTKRYPECAVSPSFLGGYGVDLSDVTFLLAEELQAHGWLVIVYGNRERTATSGVFGFCFPKLRETAAILYREL